MDFFAHQAAARKRTALLLGYYTLAVVLLVLSTYAAAMLAFHWKEEAFAPGRLDWWHAKIFLGSTGGTLAVIALGSFWRMLELRHGGAAVSQMLGGTPLGEDATEPAEQQLRNVVQEMAIASGTPVPEIHVLQDELGLNAFAAGHTINDAVIGVTRGCMQRLSRDELQGVIAHEFSHILNGDMRMNIRLMGVLHGILCLYLIGRTLLRVRSGSSRSGKKGGNPLPLFGLLLMLIGSLGVCFGRLIQAAVSRQREFLADASAVQFTRNPNGIAGALKKIGGAMKGSQLDTAQATAASHFFFANGIGEGWFNLLATHPSLEERVRRIEPTFDGRFPTVAPVSSSPGDGPLPRVSMDSAAFARLEAVTPLAAPRITGRAGQMVHVQYAANLIQSIPAELRAAAGNSWNASGLILALVLTHDLPIRSRQLAQVSVFDSSLGAQVARYAGELARQDSRARLLLLNLTLPALRALSHEQWKRLRDLLEQLVCCDAQIDLFECVLKRVIERNVDAHFEPRAAAIIQFYSFGAVLRDCAVLLSALVHVGAADPTAAQQAFADGAARLPFQSLPFVPVAQCSVQSIDAALSRLAQSVPHIRKTVLDACAHAVACDGYVKAEEAELLRAVAESMGCPLPPFVGGI